MVGLSEKPRRVVLAEDCATVRQTVKALLERGHMDVVGEAMDGDEAVRLVTLLHPDIVVLDREMPRMDGFEAAREISRADGHPPMILLTIQLAAHHIAMGLQAGIRGFVVKKDATDELRRAIEEVSQGHTFLSASATSVMNDALADRQAG
jgi:DNA-binding NarL/FixJ family response regulator